MQNLSQSMNSHRIDRYVDDPHACRMCRYAATLPSPVLRAQTGHATGWAVVVTDVIVTDIIIMMLSTQQLVGACVNQQPELFAAAVAQVRCIRPMHAHDAHARFIRNDLLLDGTPVSLYVLLREWRGLCEQALKPPQIIEGSMACSLCGLNFSL